MALDKKNDAATVPIHRCRFVDNAPSAITALAFPPIAPTLSQTQGQINRRQSAATVWNPCYRPCKWKHRPLRVDELGPRAPELPRMGREAGMNSATEAIFIDKYVFQTLPGPYPSKVDALAFTIRYPDVIQENDVPKLSDLRLFSSGGGSDLIEWDIQRSRIRRTIGSQGGSIWSLAANPASTLLALGCEDGTIRILSLENDTLAHHRRIGKVKSRMLSIAWGPPVPKQSRVPQPQNKNSSAAADSESDSDDEDDDEWVDSWLVTGCSDSSLRKWDANSGQLLERIGTDKIRGERTLVWTVGVLGDGTIISGDSLGLVKFWDSRTGTQMHSFQAHGADVLCMVTSPDGKAVYTSGVDQKTVQFSQVTTSPSENSGSSSARWVQTGSKRMHSHDVRALAMWPPHTPLPSVFRRTFSPDVAPILASGGLDMSLVLAPAALASNTVVKIANPLVTSAEASFEDAYHRRVAYTQEGRVRVSRGGRLISGASEAGLTVWRLSRGSDSSTDDVMDGIQDYPATRTSKGHSLPDPDRGLASDWEKVLEMDLNVHSNIIVHEISEDGSWLAISDCYETKLFRLHTTDDGQLIPKRIRDFSSTLQPHIPPLPSKFGEPITQHHHRGTGALALQFTPDSSKLVVSTTAPSYILVVDLTSEKPQVLRRFDHHLLQDAYSGDRVIAGPKAKTNPNGVQKPLVNGITKPSEGEDVEMKDASDDESSDGSESDTSSPTREPNTRLSSTFLRFFLYFPSPHFNEDPHL
ncbi:hypothetical protein H1R20_g8221, partial [Candolleomyces eurysporus]